MERLLEREHGTVMQVGVGAIRLFALEQMICAQRAAYAHGRFQEQSGQGAGRGRGFILALVTRCGRDVSATVLQRAVDSAMPPAVSSQGLPAFTSSPHNSNARRPRDMG